MVTVFGETRTGKSFLLNQLLGVPHFFRVSSAHEPCTAGADISDMCTLRQFAKGSPIGGAVDEDAPHIAFIDVEGNGGNGDDEHQKLVSPLLVVFNWLGSPAATDKMLQELGVVAFTAEQLLGGRAAVERASLDTSTLFAVT